ncbi:hypothetical protein B0H14DRAFT_3531058 [Mycena olivaceomarginata]|nr:hypothetical protein B0H14DRAFT_3531058 [Mycena olivaceomarginata]
MSPSYRPSPLLSPVPSPVPKSIQGWLSPESCPLSATDRRPHIAYLVLHDECVSLPLAFPVNHSVRCLRRTDRSYKAYSAGSPPSPAFVGEHSAQRHLVAMHLRYQIYAQLMLYTLGIFFVFACERHLPSVTLAPQSKVTHKIASFLRTALLACTPRRLDALPTYRPFSVDLPPDTPSFQAHALPGRLHPSFSVHLYVPSPPTLAFGDSVFTHYPLFLAYTARSLPAAWPIPRSLDLNALLFSALFFFQPPPSLRPSS